MVSDENKWTGTRIYLVPAHHHARRLDISSAGQSRAYCRSAAKPARYSANVNGGAIASLT
jgi:hypothetical protein